MALADGLVGCEAPFAAREDPEALDVGCLAAGGVQDRLSARDTSGQTWPAIHIPHELPDIVTGLAEHHVSRLSRVHHLLLGR